MLDIVWQKEVGVIDMFTAKLSLYSSRLSSLEGRAFVGNGAIFTGW